MNSLDCWDCMQQRALTAIVTPPSPTHFTSPNGTLPHPPPPLDRDQSESRHRCWPYSAPPADFTYLRAAEATAALPGPGEGLVCGGASTATEYCQEGYFCLTPLQRDVCPKDYYCREGSTDPTRCPMLSVCQVALPRPATSARSGVGICGSMNDSSTLRLRARHASVRPPGQRIGALPELRAGPEYAVGRCAFSSSPTLVSAGSPQNVSRLAESQP